MLYILVDSPFHSAKLCLPTTTLEHNYPKEKTKQVGQGNK